MPYTLLINELRKALHSIWVAGHGLEEKWRVDRQLQRLETAQTQKEEETNPAEKVKYAALTLGGQELKT
jgi:hypothetical protein